MAPESGWLPGDADDAGFQVLFVCTGNICRSPMAEAFTRRELGHHPDAGLSFASAGSHFNPTGRQHGALNAQGPHAGDLPNVTIAADGKGRLESTTELISLVGGPSSVFDADGSAIVVHAAPDDFKTDPTGNSGARIACGVIGRK